MIKIMKLGRSLSHLTKKGLGTEEQRLKSWGWRVRCHTPKNGCFLFVIMELGVFVVTPRQKRGSGHVPEKKSAEKPTRENKHVFLLEKKKTNLPRGCIY